MDKPAKCVLWIVFIFLSIFNVGSSSEELEVRRSDFPDGFLFGVSTSAYQIEGAFLEDGKSLSNWDVFSRISGSITDGKNGDVAVDHYHRYMEDIENLESLGVNAYRFSISWSRVLPRGKLGGVNQAGVDFYSKIIDNLLLRGIEPFVTIHHVDYPQEFDDKFLGWLSPLMQEEFVHFAETCFKHFGDRVKYWITINEPGLTSMMAYENGNYSPGRCSPPFGLCRVGNSDVEPLIAVHNMLLAHAKATKLYKEKFKYLVNGSIGICEHTFMFLPLTNTEDDVEAARRALAFEVGWVFDPLIFGDYPPEMRHFHGSELPEFSAEEKILLKDSIDFIGINHYSTFYVQDCLRFSFCSSLSNRTIRGFVQPSPERNGVPIGEHTGMPNFYVVPTGMEGIVEYIKYRYNNKPMMVTENGYSCSDAEENASLLQDAKRVQFHQSYLNYLARAIRNGADVRGYMVWSLLDNLEWDKGYTVKFGLYSIEPLTLNRIPKLSARWYARFLGKNDTLGSSYASL